MDDQRDRRLPERSQKREDPPTGSSAHRRTANEILSMRPRGEGRPEDAKLRTFITNDTDRGDMVAHVRHHARQRAARCRQPVVIDDSIVRGTTLKNSIIRMLDRLGPKKIVIVVWRHRSGIPTVTASTWRASATWSLSVPPSPLLEEHDLEHIVDETYQRCKEQLELGERDEELRAHDLSALHRRANQKRSPRSSGPKAARRSWRSFSKRSKTCTAPVRNHRGDWYFTATTRHRWQTRGEQGVINYVEGLMRELTEKGFSVSCFRFRVSS